MFDTRTLSTHELLELLTHFRRSDEDGHLPKCEQDEFAEIEAEINRRIQEGPSCH